MAQNKESKVVVNYFIPMIGGAFYGILFRVLIETQAMPGAMSFTFILLVPIVIGIVSVSYSYSGSKIGLAYQIFFPWTSVVTFGLVSYVTNLEGTICVAMVLPIYLILASFGGSIGGEIANKKLGTKNSVNSIALLPVLVAFAEPYVQTPKLIDTVEHAIVINAEPGDIWPHIESISDIKREEFSANFIYLIGVPYPKRGELIEQQKNRISEWEKGIRFIENIQDYRKNEYIRWTYDFEKYPIPPDALDEHVKLGGRYFDVLDTEYETQRINNNQTKLSLRIRYRVSTRFNFYAKLWARFLIEDFEKQILRLYRNRVAEG